MGNIPTINKLPCGVPQPGHAGKQHATAIGVPLHETIEENDSLPIAFFTPTIAETQESTAPHCVCIPAHWHEYLEIIYLLEDSMTAVVQSDTYKLVYGDMLVVNSGELHSTQLVTESTDCHYTLIHISDEFLGRYIPNFDAVRFTNYLSAEAIAETPELGEALDAMREVYLAKRDGWRLQFTEALFKFLHSLYQFHSAKIVETEASNASNRDINRVVEVVDWIRSHSTEDITLDDAASQVHISREYFCRLFKKYTGQTFLDYLVTVRTRNLYDDLKSSDQSLEQLLEKHGITNYKTFMCTFKHLYGVTPREVRKQT